MYLVNGAPEYGTEPPGIGTYRQTDRQTDKVMTTVVMVVVVDGDNSCEGEGGDECGKDDR